MRMNGLRVDLLLLLYFRFRIRFLLPGLPVIEKKQATEEDREDADQAIAGVGGQDLVLQTGEVQEFRQRNRKGHDERDRDHSRPEDQESLAPCELRTALASDPGTGALEDHDLVDQAVTDRQDEPRNNQRDDAQTHQEAGHDPGPE